MPLSILLALILALAPFTGSARPTAEDPDTERKAELEKIFEEAMSGAVLVGSFTVDGGGGDQALSEERYTIRKVSKIGDDLWRFDARVQYGQLDVTVPIPLAVKWAGDTPVITLTDLTIPGLGTYTARVLVFRGHYAGMWDAGDHGGKMFGRIERAVEPPTGAEGEVGEETGHWPWFRGPRASGVVAGPAPVEWDVETGHNVRWKTPIPGLAHSSPIVWGDRLFVTTAVRTEGDAQLTVGLYGSIQPVANEGEHSFRIYCLDKRIGEILWTRTAFEGVPAVPRHPKGSHAASSPATDGERVVAFFGSEGLYAWDMDGEPLWKKDFGTLDSGFFRVPAAQWGFASSPILHDGKVIVQVDVQKDSFLAMLDADTGEEIWRTPRDEVPTWCTPNLYREDGRWRIVVNGWKHMGGYDLETGDEVWKLSGGGDIPVPTPVIGDGLIYLTSAHGMEAPVYAIRTSAEGVIERDVEDDETPDDGAPPDAEEAPGDDVAGAGAEADAALAWHLPRRGNYMQTPILLGGLLYCCADNGVLACYDATTGEEHFRKRLGPGGRAGFTASPVAAGDHLYVTSEEGEVHVIRTGTQLEIVATHSMGETCMATPAVSEGTLFFRTRGHVVAIGESQGRAADGDEATNTK
jgi:outer membrane protein assembly factor BamB